MTLMVGADPEVFLVDTATKKFVSALGIIPGTKDSPEAIDRGALQVDGLAAEFNIDPSDIREIFRGNIQAVMQSMLEWLPGNIRVEVSPVAHFDPEYMKAQPEESKMLGCDPDFNAYLMDANPQPDQHPTMRTAAGHVHLGWTDSEDVFEMQHFSVCAAVTKQLDFFLGLPSVLLDPDTERKKMYGKAGAFRPKPYGCEYRVLSNFWLKSDGLIDWVFNNTQTAFRLLSVDGVQLVKRYGDVCRDIINNNNKEAAEKLCKELDIPLPQ